MEEDKSKSPMFPAKPTSRFILFAFTILLLLKFTIFITASTDPFPETGNDDDLDELLAIDEQEEAQDHPLQQGEVLNEAELVSKAQRIALELNTDSAERVINDNEFVIVLGYAPWCARSAELMPQFAEAATKLKELGSGVLMTKIDGDRYPKVASRLGIKGFPTLILFVNGSSHAYTGGFTGDDIVLWARKKIGHPIVRLSSTAEAEDFLKKYNVFVLGLFETFEGLDYEEFVKAATSDNEIQFVEVSDIRVAKILFPDIKTTKPFIGIVKGEPERYTEYEGSFEKDKILEFLDYNKFPLVTRLTELNSGRVYASPIKLQVFVFAAADDLKSLLDILQEVARKFKSKIMFISVDIADENLAKPFLTMFGLEDSENTVVTAYDNKVLSKYLLESDPTPSYLEEFCSGLLCGSLSSYFKSQPIPDSKNTNASVLIIVGKTFDDLVLSSPKNVLLEVYTSWCMHCGTTTKQVEKLAKHFKGLGSLVIARIDHSANEHPKLQVNDYPTLLFYPAEDKANPIKLSTKSSAKDLAVAINNHLKAKEVTKDEL